MCHDNTLPTLVAEEIEIGEETAPNHAQPAILAQLLNFSVRFHFLSEQKSGEKRQLTTDRH